MLNQRNETITRCIALVSAVLNDTIQRLKFANVKVQDSE